MALAIAWHIRPQQRMTVLTPAPEGKVRWTEDMWEDYYAAGEDDRRRMIEKWGEPKR